MKNIEIKILAAIGISAVIMLFSIYVTHFPVEEDKRPVAIQTLKLSSESVILVPTKLLFNMEPKEGYIETSIYEIYKGSMDGKFVDITGNVTNILPRNYVTDYDSKELEIIRFQIWGEDDGYIFVETSADKVKGAVQNGTVVKIRGYLSINWMRTTDAYGKLVHLPHIYSHDVTVIS